MSSLMNLPAEILIIIIKKLDIKSVHNLYQTCETLKNIIFMQGVIRKCNLSCSTLATSKSLQLDMIKSISGHLYELNMCGINLTKSNLLPALKKMKCLKTLDISYTQISIIDLLDLYANCSTIKNITMNFCNELKLTSKTLYDCQEVFKNFINVHFVVRNRLSNLQLQVLSKSSLDTLKFTLYGVMQDLFEREEINTPCLFKHFCMFMESKEHYNSLHFWNEVVPVVDMEKIEYIILEYRATYSIWTSSLFINFFSENFKITPSCSFDKNKPMHGTVAMFLWDKNTTIFDESFFFNLRIRIKEILACEIKVNSEQIVPFGTDTLCYDWFHVYPDEKGIHKSEIDTAPYLKKRRIVHSDHILDYDKILNGHENVKLNIYILHSVNITLSSNYEYLIKLTYFSLVGSFVRFSNDFFRVLFRCCKNLITLNVEGSSLSPCSPSVMRSIPLSQSLKNIRLVDKRVDFKTLFSSFTQCKTLENIHVIDSSIEFNELADIVLLYQSCVNLYNLYVKAVIKKSTLTKFRNMIKIVQKNPEHYLNIIIDDSGPLPRVDYHTYELNNLNLTYSPYISVFNLKPIKPV